MLIEERVQEIEARLNAATPGPYAWEMVSEKENCYCVGVAVDKDGNQVSGRVNTESYDEEADIFIEEILRKDYLGSNEGGTVNYADAEFLAHSWQDLRDLLAERRELVVQVAALRAAVVVGKWLRRDHEA